MFMKKHENSKKRQKSVAELEREFRDNGLNTAITKDNRGFKLLEKLGFRPGESLGRRRNGIKEPIAIILKEGKSGVRRDSHLREVMTKKQQQKINELKHLETRFLLASKQRRNLEQIRKDFFKAQKVCEELDYRSGIKYPVEVFYWTKETIKIRRKVELHDTNDGTVNNDKELEMYMNEENLFAIIDYLRGKYMYCIYCAITGMDIEDLKENCPGPNRDDHDNEIE